MNFVIVLKKCICIYNLVFFLYTCVSVCLQWFLCNVCLLALQPPRVTVTGIPDFVAQQAPKQKDGQKG